MTTLLIDGNNLVMRAIFAMHKHTLTANNGVRTGPLMVVINGVAKLIAEEQPTRILVAWDGGTSARRRELDPAYKAARTPITDRDREDRESTFGLVGEFLGLLGVGQLKLSGIEADDLIAAAWATMTSDAEPGKIVIASSDKDFLQLLGTNPHGVETEQIRFSSASVETDRWDENRVFNELGFAPARWPLVTALTGDTIDGVAGVPGIGPKRALKLLEAHDWDLEAVQVKLARSKPDAAARIPIFLQLVDLRSVAFPVAVPTWHQPTTEDSAWPALTKFLDLYELREISEKLHSGALWRPFTVSTGLPGRAWGKRSVG